MFLFSSLSVNHAISCFNLNFSSRWDTFCLSNFVICFFFVLSFCVKILIDLCDYGSACYFLLIFIQGILSHCLHFVTQHGAILVVRKLVLSLSRYYNFALDVDLRLCHCQCRDFGRHIATFIIRV